MRSTVLVLLFTLGACASPGLPPLRLMDAEAFCGHLRQDAPDAYPHCLRDIAFDNELRIEARQRYLRSVAESLDDAPMPVPTGTHLAPSLSAPPSISGLSAPGPLGWSPYQEMQDRPPRPAVCFGVVRTDLVVGPGCP